MALDMLGGGVDLVQVKSIRWEQTRAGRWRWRFHELADGQCDWPEVIAALRAAGYDGWLSLENLWRVPVRHTGYVGASPGYQAAGPCLSQRTDAGSRRAGRHPG
jgi:sugar phosphate isomerase/epimerase